MDPKTENPFWAGFLSELEKGALLMPAGGMAAARRFVMQATPVPRSLQEFKAMRRLRRRGRPASPARVNIMRGAVKHEMGPMAWVAGKGYPPGATGNPFLRSAESQAAGAAAGAVKSPGA